MKKKAIGGVILTAVLSVALLAGCGNGGQAGTNADNKKSDKELVVVTNATFPPFESVDTSSGTKKYVGLDIDIANQIASNLGVTLTFNDIAFSGLIGSLMDGRADFAVSAMSPTEERKKNVDFSDSYFIPRNAILAAKGSNYAALDQMGGKKIAVVFGTTYEKDAKAIPGANVVALDNSTAVIQELNNKRVDAAFIDGSQAAVFVQKNPELEFHLLPPTDDSFAFAFPKGSKWVEPFNQELKKMKDNGELNKLIEKWLGKEFSQQ
ncbi:transporter substrate-binding domain-containing protein [Brevibacillus nitrificans]|uniref:transporter substrate-binding domain-containing protein n=1 Tax=Brevibacillus nitrificans TaxID=651560 RepID=UPI0026229B71|nr:transporter substrate-binding domain-containing protein [Brevibacillus nitrificans]